MANGGQSNYGCTTGMYISNGNGPTRLNSESYTGNVQVTPNTLIGGTTVSGTTTVPLWQPGMSYVPETKESLEAHILALQAQLALFQEDPPAVEEATTQCPKCQVHDVAADDYICGECRERM